MSARVLTRVAAALLGVLLACTGLVGALYTGGVGASTICPQPPAGAPTTPVVGVTPPVGGLPPIGDWSTDQVTNAATIITVGVTLGVPPRGWVIAVATAMRESSLRNLADLGPRNDHDSLGLFQQRPSQGWGTPTQLLDPRYAATAFYHRLLNVPGWQSMALTVAAQTVQRSAYPDAYARYEDDATTLVAALTGLAGAPGVCAINIGPAGWTPPVSGPIVSGFRPPQRPHHNGVDLAVGKGTPVHAAAAGVVTVVTCNAVNMATGADWGCDRDGGLGVAGCGWYVDIDHADGVVTRYCHLLTHPAVRVGQHVNAGDVIAVSGSSGNSSGPHLHFEVHLGDHTAATATDPVAFMNTRQAPLGRP